MHKCLYFVVFSVAVSMTAFAAPQKAKLSFGSEIVEFKNGDVTLHGLLYKPKGKGPFPAVLFNHGSAPGFLNSQAADNLGPQFAKHGWVYFMPYRRGQGLSEKAGPYIMDEVKKAHEQGGASRAAEKMIELLTTDHLVDTLRAYEWLQNQKFVQKSQIAVMGNSFGGILTVLAAEKVSFCAAIDAAGAAQSWSESSDLQQIMKSSVRNSKSPLFFFQAENDYDLSPSRILSEEMKSAGKISEVKIYPAFGKTAQDGHSLAYSGSSIWIEDGFKFLQTHCYEKTPPQIRKYAVKIEPTFTNRSIRGSTEIFFKNKVNTLEFPLYGLKIDSVSVQKKYIPFTEEGSKLKIDISKIKNVPSLVINYYGSPIKGLVWGDNFVYTNYDPCTWMICFEDPGIRAAIEIQLTIPNGMKAAANGDFLKDKWSEPRPFSSYLYGFVIGDFEAVQEKSSQYTLEYFGLNPKPGELKKKFNDTGKIVQFFENKSGLRLPVKKYTQVLVPGREAQEKQGFALLGSDFVDPILLNPREDWALVHELAHQWWGNSLTCKSWEHFWLNEGLAVFMTAAYKQWRWGQLDYDREMDLAQKRYQLAVDAKFDVPLTFSGEYPSLGIKRAIVYSKAALFLNALRKEIGDVAFWNGVRNYTQKFQLKSVESKDFQMMMEKASGKNLKLIFDKWVY